MIRKVIVVVCFILAFQNLLFAHSGKPKYHVIIDTDGAIDDMRAISMLLAASDIRVLAISCSQGTLKPVSVFNKANSMLASYYHDGIPLGISDSLDVQLPVWNRSAQEINWGTESYQETPPENSIDLLNRICEDYPNDLTLIALGSLKTYADWIRDNKIMAEKVERIIWYNDDTITKGYNYSISPESYHFLIKSKIPIQIVSETRNDLVVNKEYLDVLKNTNSVYAQRIYDTHRQMFASEKTQDIHLELWDDLLPLYLCVPVLFSSQKRENITYTSLNKAIPPVMVYELIAQVLSSSNNTNNQVFNSFPSDTSLYKPQYVKILRSVIAKYGKIEWKAITMTNEIHGHTGIYSIIGAKMGIRAMEYFNVGVNNLYCTSFVGNEPPMSCFNDGIQISTGSTIGQGLIRIADTVFQNPTVIIEFNNQKIKMTLKSEISEQIKTDIEKGEKNYGFSEQYWNYIEGLAIDYWVDYDRHKIFNIEEI